MHLPRLLGGLGLPLLLASAAFALPPPQPPRAGQSSATSEPSIAPRSSLPAGSLITFVFDESISSKTARVNETAMLHLQSDIVVGDIAVAKAGSPLKLRITASRAATAPDVDGTITIYLEPLALSGGAKLPVRAAHEYLTLELTAGQRETNSLTDLAKDIFIPGHMYFRIIRRGHDLVLPRGTVLRARTASTINVSAANLVTIATPPPFSISTDPVHAEFTPVPFYKMATPKPKNTPSPSPEPSPPAE